MLAQSLTCWWMREGFACFQQKWVNSRNCQSLQHYQAMSGFKGWWLSSWVTSQCRYLAQEARGHQTLQCHEQNPAGWAKDAQQTSGLNHVMIPDISHALLEADQRWEDTMAKRGVGHGEPQEQKLGNLLQDSMRRSSWCMRRANLGCWKWSDTGAPAQSWFLKRQCSGNVGILMRTDSVY